MTLLWENEKERRAVEHEVINFSTRRDKEDSSNNDSQRAVYQPARTYLTVWGEYDTISAYE